MKDLIKKETLYKARVLERTTENKYKISVFSNEINKEIGLFYISKEAYKNGSEEINESEINSVIQFKGTLIKKYIKNKKGKKELRYFLNNIKKLKRKNIIYSNQERRNQLTKYNDGLFHEFTGIFNYKRANDNRCLFTNIILKPKLKIDHLNLKISEELEEGEEYSFKGKVIRYEKKHARGYFYGVSEVKDIKKIEKVKNSNNKFKKENERLKKENERLKKENEELKKLKEHIKGIYEIINF